jgi:amidase
MTERILLSEQPTELWQWSAVNLARAIRLRKVSSREATEACLRRLDQLNPKINAVVNVLAEEALREADEADARAKRGELHGLLHGVPVTIKENADQKGQPTTNGVAAFQTLIATEDSPPVANWKKAGAVIIGRTNTPGFSMRYDTDNDVHGPTFNPWSARRTPGGSSGGAAAAIATGIGPLAHGNDYGGSIRYPAYCCGVAGLRPTLGRVPAYNATAKAERPPTAQLMSVQGPIARDIADLRIGLAALSARDPRDPWWVPAPLEGNPALKPIRVALVTRVPGHYVHAEVAQAVIRAGRALAGAGYAVEEVAPPSIEAAAALWQSVVMTDIRTTLWDMVRELGDARLIRATEIWLEAAPELSVKEYLLALAERARHVRDWSLFMEDYPLVVGPTSGELPLERGFDTADVSRTRHMVSAQALLTTVNLLGLPSVAVPVGTVPVQDAPHGIPVGVQIIARRYREDMALDAAELIESAHGLTTPLDPVW